MQEDGGNEEEGERYRDTPRGAPVEVVCMGGDMTPPEESIDLSDFTPEHAHLLLQGFYGDFLHHNYGSHLDRGVADETIWKFRWRHLSTQLSIWYAMPSGEVGLSFTAILTAEWWEVLDSNWDSERPRIFTHVYYKDFGCPHGK